MLRSGLSGGLFIVLRTPAASLFDLQISIMVYWQLHILSDPYCSAERTDRNTCGFLLIWSKHLSKMKAFKMKYFKYFYKPSGFSFIFLWLSPSLWIIIYHHYHPKKWITSMTFTQNYIITVWLCNYTMIIKHPAKLQ